MSEPVRQSYLFLPSYAPALVYLTFFAAGLIMLFGLYRHLRSYGMGLGEFLSLSSKDLKDKLGRFAKFDLGQEKVLGGGTGGVMHGAIFYGFLMLFLYTSLIFVQSDILPVFGGGVFIKGDFYLTLEFLGDTLGILFIVGLVVAVYRRYVQRLSKLRTGWDDRVVLGMLIWIGASGFIIEALRFVAIPSQWAIFSPVGDALSRGHREDPGALGRAGAGRLPGLLVGAHVLGDGADSSDPVHQARPRLHLGLEHRPRAREAPRAAEHPVQPRRDARDGERGDAPQRPHCGRLCSAEAPRPRRVHELREVPGGLPRERGGEGPLAAGTSSRTSAGRRGRPRRRTSSRRA